MEKKKKDPMAGKVSKGILESVTALYSDLCAMLQKGWLVPKDEIRNLVDTYYQVQEARKAIENRQWQATSENTAPANFLEQILAIQIYSEKMITNALEAWTNQDVVSVWAKSMIGVGPVLASGIAAHVEMDRCPHVSNLWSFSGLDPNAKWGKGEKRPWCARMKQIAYLLGDSFCKVSGNPRSYYGREYRRHKLIYTQKNEEGEYKDRKVTTKKKGPEDAETTKALKDGKLPPFIIDRMARRQAVKLFLSHWWEVSFRHKYQKDPPLPYSATELGHTDIVWAKIAVDFEQKA